MADASFNPPQETTECYCDAPAKNTREISTDSVAVGPQLPVPVPKGRDNIYESD
jgi:hypothetical protein